MENQQPSQPKGSNSKTGTIIASLIGIAVLVLIVNAVVKKDDEDKANQNVEAVNVNQPEVTTSKVDTSNWKTYRNEELGFEVKYPALWKVTTREGDFEMVQFWKISDDKSVIATDGQAPDSSKVSISMIKDSNPDDLVKNSRFDGTYGVKLLKEGNLTIGQLSAVRLFGAADTFGAITTIIDRRDGVLFVISGSYGFDEKQLEQQVIDLSNSFRTI